MGVKIDKPVNLHDLETMAKDVLKQPALVDAHPLANTVIQLLDENAQRYQGDNYMPKRLE